MTKNRKPYILSLDIGTSSVGYAAMDEQFNVLKFHGKDAIGTLTFTAGETAEECRTHRSSRRRSNRRIKRLGLLQEVLAPLVDDVNFYRYERLHLWKNDNADFKNKSLQDVLKQLKMNPREYQTIYHLQHALQTEDRLFEPQLIYLALYHLVKHRGHFLFDRLDFKNRSSESLFDDMKSLLESYEDINDVTLTLRDKQIYDMIDILKRDDLTKSARHKMLTADDKTLSELFKLLLGMKFKEHSLFEGSDNSEDLKLEKKSYAISGDYEESMSDSLNDAQVDFLARGSRVYMNFVLEGVLKDAKCISESKVKAYDGFKDELSGVKDIIYKKSEALHHALFISTQKSLRNYENAPSSENYNALCLFDQYLRHPKKQYDALKSELKKHIDKDHDFYSMLEEDKLLRVLNTTDNASIPVQNNLYEAENILRCQMKHHPAITEEMIEKVLSIISFRIPYYVGPLVKADAGRFGWMQRKSDAPVLPWTFDDVVDKSESAERFIRRMTGKCTYLRDEDVLPKQSLLYQEMEVLNELSGIQVRPQNEPAHKRYRLSSAVKTDVMNHLFKRHKSVTSKMLLDYLKSSNDISEDHHVFGLQNDAKFTSSLSSYIDIAAILGDDFDLNTAEEIILWVTIFEDKSVLAERLHDKYPALSDGVIDAIKSLNFSGWGRLSEKFLTTKHNDISVIDVLRSSTLNMMEIVTNDDYDFQSFIRSENTSKDERVSYDDIASLAGSPAIKKGIWNAVRMTREVVSIFGDPSHIVIEFAREDAVKGKRTKSRKDAWEDIVKKGDLKRRPEYQDVISAAKRDDFDFSDDRCWLYLTQGGRCLYTGVNIDIDTLIHDKSAYEVDHIYPRRLVKDDSINNKALVTKDANQRKSGDMMPLEVVPAALRGAVLLRWKALHDDGLISGSKYSRLIKPSLSELDKEGFIARQLVETRQIALHVRDILQDEYKDAKVISMKSRFVSDLRRRFDIPKLRNLNDSHHAVDAYLNGVVYQAGRAMYPDADFFEFNFSRNAVIRKWKAMGVDLNSREKRRDLFFFNNLAAFEVTQGELLMSKVRLDIDNFKFNYVRRTGGSDGGFYNQTAYSPKLNDAKYESSKNDFVVYKSMIPKCSHVIYFVEQDAKGKAHERFKVIDEFIIESYQYKEMTEDALAMHLAVRESKFTVLEAVYLFKLSKGDLLYLKGHPVNFVSGSEVSNAKQFELDIDTQLKLKLGFDGKLSSDEMAEVYREVALEAVKAYDILLPKKDAEKEKKIQKITGFFDVTGGTVEDFTRSLNELFKMTGANASRSDVFGGRMSGMGTSTFFGKEMEAKIAYQSITGLKSTKPKFLYKIAQSTLSNR